VVSDETLVTAFGLSRAAAHRWGDLIRAVSATIVCLLAGAMIVIDLAAARNTVSLRQLQDYGMFDFSARQLRAGAEIYAPPPASADSDRPRPLNLNPPHFHLLLLPFTALPPDAAFAVWMGLSLIALAAALVMMARAVRLGAWGFASLCAAALLSPALHATMLTGQVGLLLLVPFTLAWIAARGGRDVAAGLGLGLCASIKPFVLLFAVAFVVQKRWRAAGAMGAAGLAMFMIGAMAIGLPEYAAWARQLSGVTWAEHYMNASLLGLLERTFSATPWGQHPVIDLPAVIRPLWIAAIGVVVAVTARRWITSHDVDRTFLITSAAMLLVSPLGWVYYFWFLMPPLLAVLVRPGAIGPRARTLVWIASAALLVPSPLPWQSFVTGVLTSTLGSIYAWGLLLLWIAAVATPRQSAPDS
jgi:hypothetical protein